MSNIATTIEQSKHLLELGLNPKTADMWWSNRFVYWLHTPMIGVATEQNQLYTFKWCEEDIPAWSLSALLEVMPNNDYWEICLWQYKDQRWQCVFDDVEFSNGETKAFIADTPIGAAYEMVCWLLENNLIKKGGNDESES